MSGMEEIMKTSRQEINNLNIGDVFSYFFTENEDKPRSIVCAQVFDKVSDTCWIKDLWDSGDNELDKDWTVIGDEGDLYGIIFIEFLFSEEPTIDKIRDIRPEYFV